MPEDNLRDLLPALQPNKKYLKLQKYREKRRAVAAAIEKDWASPVDGKRNKKNKANNAAATATAAGVKKGDKDAKKAKNTKKPKLTVGKAKTGKETLLKKKAAALVKAEEEKKRSATSKKKTKKAPTSADAKDEKKKSKPAASPSKKLKIVSATKEQASDSEEHHEEEEVLGVDGSDADMALPSDSEEDETKQQQEAAVAREERERQLLQAAIRGAQPDVLDDGRPRCSGGGDGADPLRTDATLYPDLDFFEDYAAQRQSEAVSEEELLKKADAYFKEFGKEERKMNRAAARYLRELRAINRRGGDKDGFTYIVPSSTKAVVRQMMQARGQGASVDPAELLSTFGGDGVRETENAPMRSNIKKKKLQQLQQQQRRTRSGSYQDQARRRWTRNAESFLNRGRIDKSMFQAKKQQRSIRKL